MAVLKIMDERQARNRMYNHPQLGTIEMETVPCPFCGKASRIICEDGLGVQPRRAARACWPPRCTARRWEVLPAGRRRRAAPPLLAASAYSQRVLATLVDGVKMIMVAPQRAYPLGIAEVAVRR